MQKYFTIRHYQPLIRNLDPWNSIPASEMYFINWSIPCPVCLRRLLPDKTRIIVFGKIADKFRVRERTYVRRFGKNFSRRLVDFSSEGSNPRKRQNRQFAELYISE
jgi:hypothetical protein